jgi:DNA-binding NarL/FixJ family response regulator
MADKKDTQEQAERLAGEGEKLLAPLLVRAMTDPDFLELVKTGGFVGLARFDVRALPFGVCKLPQKPRRAFTQREQQVATLLGQARSEVAIARELNLSLSRVRKIAAQIKRKWNASSMLEVAINACILDAFPGA